jgi:hypothetical protein
VPPRKRTKQETQPAARLLAKPPQLNIDSAGPLGKCSTKRDTGW